MDLVEYILKRYKTITKTYNNDPENNKFINNYIDEIYVINLVQDAVKRNYINYIMKKLNINYTIVVVQKIHENVFHHLSEKIEKPMTRGELGTYLSHMWCLKDAIVKNHKKFIVFEDDIMFHKEFHDYFKKIVIEKDYDFLLLGASHYYKNKDINTQNKLVYTTKYFNGNLLGTFSSMYSNTMANKMYRLRKKNIVYFDYNFYDLFTLNINMAICNPNIVITDVSYSHLNHNFNLFENGYYDKCYQNLNFTNYHFVYLTIFYKWMLCSDREFDTAKKALIYLLANYLNNNADLIKKHVKRFDLTLFSLKEIKELIVHAKKQSQYQLLYKDHKTHCKTLQITPGYLLSNRLSQFRYFCLTYLNTIKLIELPDFSPQSKLETVLIEYRKLPHMEFLIRNTIIKLGKVWSHTVVCGNTNYDFIKTMCDSISPNIKIINTHHDKMNRDTYSSFLTKKSFWEMFYGEKLLIWQEDSCVFHNQYHEFLKYDYIGAPWKQKNIDYTCNSVGNGGFSLRTKQIMIDVCDNFSIKDHIKSPINSSYIKEFNFKYVPEDRYFSEVIIQNNLGKIPNWHTASRFSEESYKSKNSFGGHQFWYADIEWQKRMFKLNYHYKIDQIKLSDHQKKITKKYYNLFHKVLLNLVSLDDKITYDLIQKSKITKKFICHLHCYNIDTFDYFFKEYLFKINKLTDIIITFCVGDPTKLKVNATILKISNKGMDIGGKFCAMQYLKDIHQDFNFILFLHSKTHDIIRKNWFTNITENLELVDIFDKHIGGYFPETIFTGDNSCLLWFNKVLASYEKIKKSLKKKNHYNKLYLKELKEYLNIKSDITCFPEGNCYVLKKNIAEKMFQDPYLYNILNTKTSFDYNWFKINYNIDISNIFLCYDLKQQKSLCGNNLEFKTKQKTLPDCMIEHCFERIVFMIIKANNLSIKLFTKDKKKKKVEDIINKAFDK